MSLRVYSTLTRTKEPFEPVEAGRVKMYLCGPTVYKSPHVGHMVGPVIFDAVKRFLTFRGFDVKWVVNITDVEDKLIDAAGRMGRAVAEVAQQYEAEYKACLADLGVASGAGGIDAFPRASEHIGDIVALCEALIERGHAYAGEGSVYFAVRSDDDYGKLSGRRVEEQEAGTRDVESAGKRDPADFALWKAAKPGEPSWPSPWGDGRPGWHVECSAMAMKLLGETIDIHGGGMDLMFPHHENELAQSESATGKPFARVWMHNGLTRLKTKAASGEWKSEKMAGSVGNVVPARDLIDRHGPDLLRYLILSTHYRSPIDFSDETVASATKGLASFTRLFERVARLGGGSVGATAGGAPDPTDPALAAAVEDRRGKFLAAMDDDFNTAGAIAALHELAGEINAHVERLGLERRPDEPAARRVAAAVAALKQTGTLLGLFASPAATPKSADDGLADRLVRLLIDLRADARQRKDFALSDAIRDKLAAAGVTLEDRPGGTEWRV